MKAPNASSQTVPSFAGLVHKPGYMIILAGERRPLCHPHHNQKKRTEDQYRFTYIRRTMLYDRYMKKKKNTYENALSYISDSGRKEYAKIMETVSTALPTELSIIAAFMEMKGSPKKLLRNYYDILKAQAFCFLLETSALTEPSQTDVLLKLTEGSVLHEKLKDLLEEWDQHYDEDYIGELLMRTMAYASEQFSEDLEDFDDEESEDDSLLIS